MTAFLQARARSAWRLVVQFDGAFGGLATAATYALARADGARCTAAVRLAWAIDAAGAELALTEPLLEGALYTLTAAGVTGAAQVAHRAALAQAVGAARAEDPEAEAFGVDWDWLAPALAAGGDLPEVRGRRCLPRDLAAIAVTEPGELFHRPDEGVGLGSDVNGTRAPDEIAGALRRQWGRDDRVAEVRQLRVTVDTSGTAHADAGIRTIALAEPVPVTTRS